MKLEICFDSRFIWVPCACLICGKDIQAGTVNSCSGFRPTKGFGNIHRECANEHLMDELNETTSSH